MTKVFKFVIVDIVLFIYILAPILALYNNLYIEYTLYISLCRLFTLPGARIKKPNVPIKPNPKIIYCEDTVEIHHNLKIT